MHSSQNEASKVSEANCSTRLSAFTTRRVLWLHKRLAAPPWLTTTPLGIPVDPEV